MNIGGIHIFGGIFFLLLITVIIYTYFLICFLLYSTIRWFVRYGVHRRSVGARFKEPPKFITEKYLRGLGLIFFILLGINSSIYLVERAKWMGDSNAHYKAKEYFVAGQVLDLYRIILTNYVHPDNTFLQPLHYLQRKIYNKGTKYLPESDGEKAVWTGIWFVNPYSKRFRIPKGYIPYINAKITPPMVANLLDDSWFYIQTVSEKSIADSKLYIEYYLKCFPAIAHYYTYHEYFYTGHNVGGAFIRSKRKDLIMRCELLIKYLELLKKRWDESGDMKIFLQRHPEVNVYRQVTYLLEMSDLLLAKINSDEFRCDDQNWQKYSEMREEFIGGRSISSLQSMKDQETAKKFEYVVIHSRQGKFNWYVFNQYCSMTLPGKVDFTEERERGRNYLTLIENLERNLSAFENELTKVKEQSNGNK